MNILIIILIFFATIGIVKVAEGFYRSLRYVRLQKIRGREWNSFTGFQNEQEQINETLDRR